MTLFTGFVKIPAMHIMLKPDQWKKQFLTMDGNADGQIDVSEFVAFFCDGAHITSLMRENTIISRLCKPASFHSAFASMSAFGDGAGSISSNIVYRFGFIEYVKSMLLAGDHDSDTKYGRPPPLSGVESTRSTAKDKKGLSNTTSEAVFSKSHQTVMKVKNPGDMGRSLKNLENELQNVKRERRKIQNVGDLPTHGTVKPVSDEHLWERKRREWHLGEMERELKHKQANLLRIAQKSKQERQYNYHKGQLYKKGNSTRDPKDVSLVASSVAAESTKAPDEVGTSVGPRSALLGKIPVTLSPAALIDTLSPNEARAAFKEYLRPFRCTFKAYVKSQVPSTGTTFENMVATRKEMAAATYLRCLRDHGLLTYKEKRVDKERWVL